MTPEQIRRAWNAQADKHNQWNELDEEERLEWAVAQARAELIAEMIPIAWVNLEGTEIAMAHDKWRRPNTVIPLAIIPDSKE